MNNATTTMLSCSPHHHRHHPTVKTNIHDIDGLNATQWAVAASPIVPQQRQHGNAAIITHNNQQETCAAHAASINAKLSSSQQITTLNYNVGQEYLNYNLGGGPEFGNKYGFLLTYFSMVPTKMTHHGHELESVWPRIWTFSWVY